MDFEKMLESVKTVRLTGGIFGKTSMLLVVLCISVSAVCLKIGAAAVGAVFTLMLILMGLVAYALKRCLDFAEKNPHAAIMEGAELLVHERIVHARKGVPAIPPLDPVVDHEMPPLLEADAENPDPPPTAAIEHEGKQGDKGANK